MKLGGTACALSNDGTDIFSSIVSSSGLNCQRLCSQRTLQTVYSLLAELRARRTRCGTSKRFCFLPCQGSCKNLLWPTFCLFCMARTLVICPRPLYFRKRTASIERSLTGGGHYHGFHTGACLDLVRLLTARAESWWFRDWSSASAADILVF